MPLNNYTNPKDTYQASSQVLFAATMTGNAPFGNLISNFSDTTTLISFLGPPVAIAALGILSCIFLNVGWCTRCCCTCSKCLPNQTGCCSCCCPHAKEGMSDDMKIKAVSCRRYTAYIILFLFLFFTLVADMASFSGNVYVLKGVNDFSSVIDGLSTIFTSLTTEGNPAATLCLVLAHLCHRSPLLSALSSV
jgi:hypothetical protein